MVEMKPVSTEKSTYLDTYQNCKDSVQNNCLVKSGTSIFGKIQEVQKALVPGGISGATANFVIDQSEIKPGVGIDFIKEQIS